jgi:hypothetical protein
MLPWRLQVQGAFKLVDGLPVIVNPYGLQFEMGSRIANGAGPLTSSDPFAMQLQKKKTK